MDGGLRTYLYTEVSGTGTPRGIKARHAICIGLLRISLEHPMTIQTNLGDLISTIYEEFLSQYGDEELASVATAAVINDLLSAAATRDEQDEAA